ncbi:MAG: hypothetical protein V3W45_01375 [Sedimentisphaerales bacterium]
MVKKSIILGLILLLGGTAVFSLVTATRRKQHEQAAYYQSKYAAEYDDYMRKYNHWLQSDPQERAELPWGIDEYGQTKPKASQLVEQQERLKADLDKLAAGETDTYPFADFLYGKDWQKKLNKYKTQKEMSDLFYTVSIVSMLVGTMILTSYLLLRSARLFIRGFTYMKKLCTDFFKQRKQASDIPPAETRNKESKEISQQRQEPSSPQAQLKKHSKVLVDSGWQSVETDNTGLNEPPQSQTNLPVPNKTCSNNSSKNAGIMARLFSDDKSVELEESSEDTAKSANLNTKTLDRVPKDLEETASSDSHEVQSTLKTEGSIQAQTENMEKHIAEFRQMAQTIQQTACEHSEPLNNTLRELTEQVSAIREYASQQQHRVSKLQDGYDWNIIRTFCLRIIHCIDNLENRIERMARQNIETSDLVEVRDELIFALESSGVEQFEPEINSDYHRQQKKAEAVKDRELADDPNLKGTIAKVLRRAYQFFIDEMNFKVVRTAQVKLFG